MNKNIILAALFAATTASAGINVTGDYEGVILDNGTYTQELNLNVKGGPVSATLENLEDSVSLTELYVETTIEGLDFKGGTSKSHNGTGLLQAESEAVNQISIATTLGSVSVLVNQVSGESATVDTGISVSGVNITVQNVSNTDRFISAVFDFFGFGVTVEKQNDNIGVAASANLAINEGTTASVTGVVLDITDASGVTQDDGILGDVSDATGRVTGVVVTLGDMTGKYINKNSANTLVLEVQRGNVEYAYSKTNGEDGVLSATVGFNF